MDYDVLIEPDQPVEIPTEEDTYLDIEEIESWTAEERTCLLDRGVLTGVYAAMPAGKHALGVTALSVLWSKLTRTGLPLQMEIPEKMFFHVMRAYHLAGRCVGCDACVTVCPMDIPLGKLNRKVAKEIPGYVWL